MSRPTQRFDGSRAPTLCQRECRQSNSSRFSGDREFGAIPRAWERRRGETAERLGLIEAEVDVFAVELNVPAVWHRLPPIPYQFLTSHQLPQRSSGPRLS